MGEIIRPVVQILSLRKIQMEVMRDILKQIYNLRLEELEILEP